MSNLFGICANLWFDLRLACRLQKLEKERLKEAAGENLDKEEKKKKKRYSLMLKSVLMPLFAVCLLPYGALQVSEQTVMLVFSYSGVRIFLSQLRRAMQGEREEEEGRQRRLHFPHC